MRDLEPSLPRGFLEGVEGISHRFREATAAGRAPGEAGGNLIPLASLTACLEERQRFQWKAGNGEPGGDSEMEVVPYHRDSAIFRWTSRTGSLSYPEGVAELTRGSTYRYRLRSLDAQGPPARTHGPFFFTVLPADALSSLKASLERIEKLGITGMERRLLRGLPGAAGVDGEALPHVEALARGRCGSAPARMPLASIQAVSGDERGLRESMEALSASGFK